MDLGFLLVEWKRIATSDREYAAAAKGQGLETVASRNETAARVREECIRDLERWLEREASGRWSEEQLAMLEEHCVPERLRQEFGMLGTDPFDVEIAVWNALRCSYWPELTLTSCTLELRIWELPQVESGMKLDGQPVLLHPSVWGAERTDREPDKVFLIDARLDNREMGVQLAVAVWHWFCENPKIRSFYVAEADAWDAKQAEKRPGGEA